MTTMNANAPNTASCTTCCVCCKKFRSMPPSPRKARNTSNISAGLDCYERFQARAKAATESDIAPVLSFSEDDCTSWA
ncbi:DUF3330 domain-containing protein [Enterobacter kobei]|uniref:DUF3330 domain-containing protein n=1 Tax=Enterobacter kobei TaxID=208224 RepID=UPI003D7A9E64